MPPLPARVRVLNVNDNAASRYTIGLMLERAGFEVIEAASGSAALELVRGGPDVMVLDVRLPDIEGFEVCRRVKSDAATAGVKVLLTSATFVTLEKRVQGLDHGADGYLTQPFEPEELAATVHALARLRYAETRLKHDAASLVESDRLKDEFLAMLAHELRNPLAAVAAALPVLRNSVSDEKAVRAVQVVQRQTHHLKHLLDDLLDVARVTHGRIELKREPIELTELLARVVESCRDGGAARRHQTLVYEPGRSSLTVDGDVMRLEQVFTNLLDNASQYTGEGGKITVGVREVHGNVRVTIRDTGVGIARQELPRIFDLFSQSGVTIDRTRGGLGIGLTMVKKLVELHGGRVSAASGGLGEGSEFLVELPVVASKAASGQLAGAGAASDARRIVVVEDNVDLQQSLVDLCEMWGHRVKAASDGVAGLDAILEEQPDVALVDIGLPGIDGYEIARRVRADDRGKNLVLVALTGYGSTQQRAASHLAGFDLHMVKPPDTDALERLLREEPLAKRR